MTQYPYPSYQPPTPYSYDPNLQRLYAPARRSAILMFVMAGFLLLCGTCVGVVARFAPLDELANNSGLSSEQFAQLGTSPANAMRMIYAVLCIGSILLAIVFGVLGFFVRKGGIASAVVSLILVILMVLFLLLQTVAVLFQALSKGGAESGFALVIFLVPLGLMVWLLFSLIGAVRAATQISAAQGQYAMQYMQMHQQAYQQGAYAGYGYGYGYGQPQQPGVPPPQQPPQPPPPVPPPPPPSSQQDRPGGSDEPDDRT
jgi:hypothetical protein